MEMYKLKRYVTGFAIGFVVSFGLSYVFWW